MYRAPLIISQIIWSRLAGCGWIDIMLKESEFEIIVVVSANIEWLAVRQIFPSVRVENSPFGEYFQFPSELLSINHKIIVFHGGWGKIAAAASTQYVIDRWRPKLLINLGTCGGIEGKIERGAIILADRTIVYDIYEQMGDSEGHILHYTTELDLSWLRKPYPEKVQRTLLVSGDRDLNPDEIKYLNSKYGAVAGDWESGAIAHTAKRNRVPCLILRGVSDLVSESGGEAYEDADLFKESAKSIMGQLMMGLEKWIDNADVFIG
jgi:adenosylhomocysteine nucleosidase